MAYEHENEDQPERASDESSAERVNGAGEAWPAEPGMTAPGEPEAASSAATGADDDSDAPIAIDAVAGGVGGTSDIRADHVTLTQGGANRIDANAVEINQGGAGMVRAREVTVNQGGIGFVGTESLTVAEGGSAFAVMAERVQVDEGGNVFLLVGRSVSGEVRPVLDWRAALALGAGLGAVLSLLRRRRH